MPASFANVRRHFLPWDRPLLPQAVEYLASDWKQVGPLDLSTICVVVPTRQSGRRLREALAAHAARFSTAVFPPRVLLPDGLIAAAEEAPDAASRPVALLAWVEVFCAIRFDDFRKVFPIDPPRQDFGWALRLARQFTRLQHLLAESGLLLSSVATRVGDTFPEAERWEQIARLEELHAARLASRELRDRHRVRIEAVDHVGKIADQLSEGSVNMSRLLVIGVPDPQPLAVSVLAALSATIPVEILVFAPPSESASFDEWGRPSESIWSARELEVPDFENHVYVGADPASQAARTADVLRRYERAETIVGVGVADADVLPALESALQHAGLVAFTPEGRKRKGNALYQLVAALAALAADEAFANVQTLARCPDFLKFLRAQLGFRFSAAEFLRQLDRLHARHLPPTLTEACRHSPDMRALEIIAELRRSLRSGAFPENVASGLASIFATRRFDTTQSDDAAMVEAAGAWSEVLTEIAAAAKMFPQVAPEEWWELTLQFYAETVHYDEKPPTAIELQGWLELLWEDASHLIVCGFNDGRVPEAVVGDPFLPEGLRERLGLKTNAMRFARDAYLLQALAHSRAQSGRLDLFLGKTSTAGDPLRPSRLLLRCTDEALPQRVEFLFKRAEMTGSNLAWKRAWQLCPRRVTAPSRIAVTALKSWLACPFRFYLSRMLRMEPVNPAKTELDVFDFGILCHSALEAMGSSPVMGDCADPSKIREFLFGRLEEDARKRFGTQLTLPLVVQLESARQRLSRAADVQAGARAEGWIIQSVETSFILEIGGLQVTGKIDRIDRNERTGAVRVLDYKTSDQPVDPWHAHVRGIRKNETAPEFARFVLNGREYVWNDLQLPLYLRALRTGGSRADGLGQAGNDDATGTASVVGAYFNLPKASTETGIRAWEDYTLEIDEAAWKCADGVAKAIREGTFWPPNENIRADYDDFAPLFHHGVADSVIWSEGSADTQSVDLDPKPKGRSA